MKSIWTKMALLLLVSVLAFGYSAFAFSDTQGDPGEASIKTLEQRGIVDGMGDGRFVPGASLTYAQSLQLLVKSFKLNIDHIQFFKEPLASDYYTKAQDDAWYASSLIIAQHNGLLLPRDVDPDAPITREEYADLLCKALLATGPYAFIEIFILLGDADQVTPERMGSIQTLLIAEIAKLDEQKSFRPKESITRSEAAVWLYKALTFMETYPKTP